MTRPGARAQKVARGRLGRQRAEGLRVLWRHERAQARAVSALKARFKGRLSRAANTTARGARAVEA